MNPGSSVKERIERKIVVDALKEGKIKKCGILIEPTSGNTDMVLSIAAVSKGLRMIISIPKKMSQELGSGQMPNQY